MKKKFAYYCSGGASRILRFYDNSNNLIFSPEVVIYDGSKDTIIQKLKSLFQEKLFLIRENELSDKDKKRIHSYTSNFIHNLLDRNNIDYLICFGDKILKSPLINSYKNKLINFHPSLLPAFKGLNAINQALNYGAPFIGNSAHFIEEGIDTGKIIIQSAMPSNQFQSYEDLLELQFPLLKLILRDLLNYEVKEKDVFLELVNREKDYFISTKKITGTG